VTIGQKISLDDLATWRRHSQEARLVLTTQRRALSQGIERLAAQLADAKIDAISMPYPDWNGGTVALFHRFGVLALGSDAQLPRSLAELLDMGIDGVYSQYVDRMVAAISRCYSEPSTGL